MSPEPSQSLLPARVYPPNLFVDKSTPIGILCTNPKADTADLIYNHAYGCCYLENHRDQGLILGVRNDQASFRNTQAATGVPINRHVLICTSPMHAGAEVIVPDDMSRVRVERCFAVIEAPYIVARRSHEFKLIDVGNEYLVIENGAQHNYYSFPRDQGPPPNDRLKEQHPGCVIVVNHIGRKYTVLTPLGLEGFQPISSIKF